MNSIDLFPTFNILKTQINFSKQFMLVLLMLRNLLKSSLEVIPIPTKFYLNIFTFLLSLVWKIDNHEVRGKTRTSFMIH